jgi:hypothetical protein
VVEIHKHTDWLNANRYTVEERERICRELLGEAQYWNIHLYIKHMHDSTKRPWVGLTDEDQFNLVHAMNKNDWHAIQMMDAIEAKLKEKNT